MLRTTFLLVLAVVILCPRGAAAQENELWRSWNQPVEPFQIIGNVYYVGASDIGSFLITGAEGHVLIDGGFPETAAIIRASIARLGFRIEDVKVLLNSHAHFDHAGGVAELKQASGAQLFVSEGDADLFENGGRGDFLMGDTGLFPAASVDRRLTDGEVVRLGETALTARLTPGHTRGCTTWTMQVEDAGRTYDVVFACSVSVLPDVRLLDEPSYPGIAEDFERTFAVLKALPCDVFLAAHGMFYGLTAKRAALQEGSTVNPFIDPERYQAYVARGEKRFRERLAKERGTPGG